MSETKKYISIPTIDNCELPNSLIRRCKEVYNRYGKWKLYDLLNEDLNNHNKYTKSDRDRFKEIELTKRYLYLYRKAMAETLSFAYNVDQTDLIDKETLEFDNKNVCPYCGNKLTLLTQIGSKKGFPKSHFNDVVKKYDKVVLFNNLPLRSSISISLSEYLKTINPGIQIGYSFVYWSFFQNNHVNVDELLVNPADPTTRITEEEFAVMDKDAKDSLVSQGQLNLFNYVDRTKKVTDSEGIIIPNENYNKLTVYAVFKSDSDTVYSLSKFTLNISVKEIFDIYTSSLKVNNKYKPAFDYLTTKDKYYDFNYLALDTDEDRTTLPSFIPEKDYDILGKTQASDYVTDDLNINTITVYKAKSIQDNECNYADWGMSIRQLAIQVFKEPLLKDIIYKSTYKDGVIVPTEGTEEVAGIYKFFQWSLYEEGDIFILEDENSRELVRSIESVLEDNIFTIYALFKYDIKLGTYAYDDDCYNSLYHHYKGIDKAYVGYTDPTKGFVYEYKINDLYESDVTGEFVTLNATQFKRLPLASKKLYIADGSEYVIKDPDYRHKETINGHESYASFIPRISAEAYSSLPDGICRSMYDEQKSLVAYRGYAANAGSGSGYVKDNKIKVIKYTTIKKNTSEGTVTSVEFGRKEQNFANMGDTDIELTYTTPGDFEIWYYLPRDLWYIYDSEIDDDRKDALQIVWVYNSDPTNESKYKETVEESEKDLYTCFIKAKLIGRTEYLTLSSENKNRCVIKRIYYEHVWEDESYTTKDSSGHDVVNKYYIQEIFNCKSISEYNTQVGTPNDAFGVDTKEYADMTRETYRVYQYKQSFDKNVESDASTLPDNEIHYVEAAASLTMSDTWLFPITESNRLEFLDTILRAKTQLIRGDTRFLRSGKIIFLEPDIRQLITIPETETEEERLARESLLDYTRLVPTDNTGSSQMYYKFTGLWKCVLFDNGQILVYRAGDRVWPEIIETDFAANPITSDEIILKNLVHKYIASISINIDHSIDEQSKKYVVRFKDIKLKAAGVTNYNFFNSNEEEASLVDTVVSLAYTSRSDIIDFESERQYIKYSNRSKMLDNVGEAYMCHLTKDILKQYFNGDESNAKFFFEVLKESLIDPESPDYYVYDAATQSYIKTDGNLKYAGLKDVTWDNLDDYYRVTPTRFEYDQDGENYNAKKEYFDLVDGSYVPLSKEKFIVEDNKIVGLATDAYVKGIYTMLQWDDIFSLVTEQIYYGNDSTTRIERLKPASSNPLLYRAETLVEESLRKLEYYSIYGTDPDTGNFRETKAVLELSGKRPSFKPEDGSETVFESSVYSKFNASSSGKMPGPNGGSTLRPVNVSGNYPDPSIPVRSDEPIDNQFVKWTVNYTDILMSQKLTLNRVNSSTSVSDDISSIIDDNKGEGSGSFNDDNVVELDSKVWWNQYSKELTGKSKNDFITEYGVNFSGWIWTGWAEPARIDGETVIVGGTSKKVEGGLIEAYPFEEANRANYVTQGFQRILFPKDVNSTFETEQYDTTDESTKFITTHNRVTDEGKFVNRIDPKSFEPTRLLRYCSNQSCELYLKRLDKRKWSFHNADKGIPTTNSISSLYNNLALDEYLLPISKDGSFKNVKANKFAADEPDKSAKFGISDIPKLVTVEPNDPAIPEYGGWTLDKYPWHYGEDDATKLKYNEYVRYYLHRGGRALPDPFRFEFEWKYATDEYSSTKMSNYGNGSGLDNPSIQSDTIKEIGHRPKNRIIPMESRPIEVYQQKYLDNLFNTFENVYIQLNSNASPYSLFSPEEIDVYNNIIRDLFTFNKKATSDHMTDYLDFKLSIVVLMNDMAEFEFNRENYWNDPDYELNKQLLESFYERNHNNSTPSDLNDLTDVQFTDTVAGLDIDFDNPQNIFPYYTNKLTLDVWDKFENKAVKKLAIKREFEPENNITIRDILYKEWGGAPTYPGFKFKGYFKDSLTFNQYYPDTSEGTTVVPPGTKLTVYLLFEAGEIVKDESGNETFVPGDTILTESFAKNIIKYEDGNEIYLKTKVIDSPSKIWYSGKEAVVASIKERLSDLHEKLMLPCEFMCSLFNFIVATKHYNILENDKGEISSLFVPASIVTYHSNKRQLSISKAPTNYKYTDAVLSKPWNVAIDDSTGKSVKEQYYIVYNDNSFDAYSFFNEGWLKDVYGVENATVKFPLYRDTENPLTHNSGSVNKLIKIIPFSTNKYESALALIYNRGIVLVNLTGFHSTTEDTQWIKLTDGDLYLTLEKLFYSENVTIVDCVIDEFNNKNNLVIISSDSQIVTYDLEKEIIYTPNKSYVSGAELEDVPEILANLPIMFNKSNANTLIGSTETRALGVDRPNVSYKVQSITNARVKTDDFTEDTYLEKRVGLVLLAGYLQPSGYTGDPWILLPKYANSGLPSSLSDINYEKLFDIDKDKYQIHPKLTVQYAWDNSPLKNIVPESKVNYTYTDLYTDEFTPSTEGDFRIYQNGNLINKSTYFGYSDEMKKSCLIYKNTTVEYSFVRLSFSNVGTGFYDKEFSARLTKEKPLYLFYYKSGVKVDEHYGYKIQQTEYIIDGKDQYYSDEFNEYLTIENSNVTGNFNEVKEIPGWKLVNDFSDYSKNIVEKIDIIDNIRMIFPINGYIDSKTGSYINQYLISDGYITQLIQWVNGVMRIICEYDFKDNNELVAVKTLENEITTYLIFKNQRVVALETYEYVPSEVSIPRMDKIKFLIKTDQPSKESGISYVTTDNRVVNISFTGTSNELILDNPTFYTNVKEGRLSENSVSMINCKINQTDPFKFVSNNKRWLKLEANDRSNLMESQIN